LQSANHPRDAQFYYRAISKSTRVAPPLLEDFLARAFYRAFAAPDDAGAARSKMRILIVEDEYLLAWQLENALRSAGYGIAGLAVSAEEAVRLAESERPTLIIMDVRLVGERAGVDAAIELYTRFGTRSIFASANASEALRERARPANPLTWISKPYMPQDIMRELEKLIPESDA